MPRMTIPAISGVTYVGLAVIGDWLDGGVNPIESPVVTGLLLALAAVVVETVVFLWRGNCNASKTERPECDFQ